MSAVPETTAAIGALASLPPLPGPAAEIIDQFSDEFIEVSDVTRVVERDPGITARLLGLANSAFFNLPEPITEMEEAIARVLGVATVRSIVFAMALKQAFDSSRCPAFDAERFWLDALCVAEACKKLARNEDDPTLRNLAYPAGLCHNLGLLALAHLEPAATGRSLIESASDPSPNSLLDRLVAEFGTDHRQATAHLAAAWRLPEALVGGFRGRTGAAADANRLSAIIDACALAVGNRSRAEEERRDLDACASRLGLSAEALAAEVQPGERQLDRLKSVAGSLQS